MYCWKGVRAPSGAGRKAAHLLSLVLFFAAFSSSGGGGFSQQDGAATNEAGCGTSDSSPSLISDKTSERREDSSAKLAENDAAWRPSRR